MTEKDLEKQQETRGTNTSQGSDGTKRMSQDNDSLASSLSLTSSANQPVAIDGDYDGYDNDDNSSRRISSSINSLIRSITPGSVDTNQLSKKMTSYSVKDIYGETPDEIINLRRTQSKKSVIKTLSERIDKDDTYKDVPDIAVPTADYGHEFRDIDPELITWEGDDDPNFPRNWSLKDKVIQTAIVSTYTLVTPMSSSISSPASAYIAKDFGITNNAVISLTVSIMILAFAIGPLIIAPLSESDKIGRRPVLNISIWILLVFNIGCGFAKTTTQLCVLRFLGGLGGCASLNVGAGTIADLYDDKSRNVAMAVYSICPTMGPVISPIASGFIVMNMKWNWCFYVISMFTGVVAIIGTLFFKETYSPRLLKKKADFLRKETGNDNLHTVFEMTENGDKMQVILVTVLRPVKLLMYHPMVIGLGSFMAFTYGFMYLMLVTFPRVFENSYNFSVGITGLMFIPMGLGYVCGIITWTYFIGRIYNKLTDQNGGQPKPEYRLPCLVFSGFGIPGGLIWYGWSVQYKVHWIVPSMGSFLFAFSFIAVFQTIQNYLIDMNPRFSASSIAAAAVFRSLFGFAFPLFANNLYDTLDYGWGNTLCAFIGLLLGIPFPIFCFKYGEALRNWANKKFEGEQAKVDEQVMNKQLDGIPETHNELESV